MAIITISTFAILSRAAARTESFREAATEPERTLELHWPVRGLAITFQTRQMNELGFTPYADRRIQFLGLRRFQNCKLKIYSVLFGENEIDLPRFEHGLDIASRDIPPVDASLGRIGVGFAIFHQGRTGDYVVLSWWDRENELPTRVYVSDHGDWRPAGDCESFCVWDLEIISFERDAYLKSILCPTGASMSDYLEGTFPSDKASS